MENEALNILELKRNNSEKSRLPTSIRILFDLFEKLDELEDKNIRTDRQSEGEREREREFKKSGE
jgi:hypothetical protein